MTLFRRFLRHEDGATAIEYALVASLIGMMIVGAVTIIGGSLGGIFGDVAAGF